MAQPPFPRLNDIITDLDACTLEEAIVEILQKTVPSVFDTPPSPRGLAAP